MLKFMVAAFASILTKLTGTPSGFALFFTCFSPLSVILD
jgi:hypothetical protein